ncbi:23S rRNA (uracil(1939)-C(5))-methyltransferase RlmD [Paraglaciecola aquimarina]|uniref:23S rRNA (uracil(1939)-C(5))-methyltransferase RlmD n=1 Tax=Paraglaciecola aquimarina TaxID=1235557 RepID=A0ABU3SVU9_9ALTE|nr:23S rRNA (uracil(1939)-C(5))-methyltransferase RlmD [Paraglaciecola aquimarina]MDU0354141.1 23S rRNA (uracil(1939)-C(5))-methyltransferase RlmD [Paraglaciecola aquimarina]
MRKRFFTSNKAASSPRSHRKNRGKHPSQPMGPIRYFRVEGLTHEGKGVARADGKVTFIAGALPGEKVTAQVVKSNRRFDEAKLVDIEQPSVHRVTPACSHYAECGGCSFQHLTVEQQRESKKIWLQGQLRKVCSTDDIMLLADSAMGYRRRARLAIRVVDEQLLLGFRGNGTQQIVSIDNCIVLTEPLQQTFVALKSVLLEDAVLGCIAAKLGHVELLEDDKGVSVLFRLTGNVEQGIRTKWSAWAEMQNVELYWQFSGENRANVSQVARRQYQVDDFALRYHPQDFIQVNAAMNAKMVEQAMQWLAPSQDDVILDLFCGVGNFSLPLAKRAKQVVGVEVQESMVKAGQSNAQTNHLSNLSFVAADLTQATNKDITSYGVTKVLLDPPRAGAIEFLPSLVKLKPKQILYVSCDAATLARDAEYLLEKRYKVKRVAMMDMFPQTAHLETMLLFSR